MPISALPTPPSRSDSPQDFSDRADALLGALPGFVTEANALQSDVNAKEASASSYATIATSKASEAQASATTASTKASEAAASAVAAAAAASNAEIAFDSFDDKYLGSKASDPATDNDGNPLLTGALYWNTSVGAVRVWNGSAWLSMAADASIVDFQQAGAGAVVRTAQDKMREWVSVKDFGAVGDGVTDDTNSIQAAVDYAVSAGVGLVYLSGKFLISDTIVIDTGDYLQGIIIQGDGNATQIIQSGANKDVIHFSTTNYLRNSSIKDVEVRSGVTSGHGINVKYGAVCCKFENVNVTVLNPSKHCYVGDYSAFPLDAGGVYDTTWEGGDLFVTAEHTTNGVKFITNGTTFNENTIRNMRVNNAKGAPFFYFQNVYPFSYLVNNRLQNINFEGCNAGGIAVANAKNWTFDSLSFWDAKTTYTGNLIWFIDSAGYSSTHNTLVNITRNGDTLSAGARDIYLQDADLTTVINCYTDPSASPLYDWNDSRVVVVGAPSAGEVGTARRISLNHQSAITAYACINGTTAAILAGDGVALSEKIGTGVYKLWLAGGRASTNYRVAIQPSAGGALWVAVQKTTGYVHVSVFDTAGAAIDCTTMDVTVFG